MPLEEKVKAQIKQALASGKLDPNLMLTYNQALSLDEKPEPRPTLDPVTNMQYSMPVWDGSTILNMEVSFRAEGTPSKNYPFLTELTPGTESCLGMYAAQATYGTLLDLLDDPGLLHFHKKRMHQIHTMSNPTS